MSKSIALVTNRYTAALRSSERQTKAEITAAHIRLQKQTRPTFAQITRQFTQATAQAQQGNRPMGLWWLYEQNRLHTVQQIVTSGVGQYATSASQSITQGRRRALEVGAASAIAQLRKKKAIPRQPAPAHQQALDEEPPVQFHEMTDDTRKRVQHALMLAATAGITLTMLMYLLNNSIDRLLAFVIGIDVTVEYDAFRDELQAWYYANNDVVQAWQWSTAEDERVCPFCESMDGSIHDLGEAMESHPRCRCEMEPYFIDTSGSPLLLGP